ncbi:MAG: DNA (cytosine-5-)-methyltransferase [Thermodesulfovibrionia bacterium]|nr:DNA (cytosine-5-)-methyltransferase [Thermodesulfovibrionia bacterium]
MPQIHIKLNPNTHKKLLKKAKEYNYSIQEFVEKSIMMVAEDKEPFFAFRNADKDNRKYRFTFIDLFAGIGGIRTAFEVNGGKCIFSSEWDRWSQKTYFENFGELPHGDINEIKPNEIPDHEILTAGFPCQPFSIAGVSKKKSLGREHGFKDKTQGTLFFKIAEILEKKRPKAFMLENVKNLKGHDGGNTYKIIEGTLKELGYKVFADIIDASCYVPQHRERLFIVGFDRKVFGDMPKFSFPDPVRKRITLSEILEKKVDPKYILSTKLWQYLQDYAEKHRLKGNGFGYGICDRKSVARTLSARYYKDGSEILIKIPNSNPRRLTPRECARLMGFDDSFKIPVSDTQAYRQFGNSVAVPVVSAVAGELVKTCSPFLSNGKPA